MSGARRASMISFSGMEFSVAYFSAVVRMWDSEVRPRMNAGTLVS